LLYITFVVLNGLLVIFVNSIAPSNKFDIYVFIDITGLIPLMVNY